MRLYLSSYRLGNQPQELTKLLRGGRRAAVIANAADAYPADKRPEAVQHNLDELAGLGLEPTEVDLRDYFGKTQALEAKLREFDLIYVRGGNCFVLRRAFKYSGADEVIARLLKEDAVVYAGYSAGIDQLCLSLRGADLVDDPHNVPAGYQTEIIWDGMGVVPYAIAPHYRSDHPESADIEKSVEYLIDHHIPFIALRDGQAIVREGDRESVVG
ncbi:MAG TPA: Type 1 glutamine amidotransferase-like domain-containing protein [Candidatus Saccharimonadia bacterium]|jgi:dipeptidase E|nr:Type 1 glutamine amidotransferase-like domain-containing protein [Candidatus Saccharimonadia bacterium]